MDALVSMFKSKDLPRVVAAEDVKNLLVELDKIID
jgi:hypothetical protein